MRLFIAINFDDDTKRSFLDVQDRLRELGRGNFTREENLHMTLAFLGEVPANRIDEVKRAMDAVNVRIMKLDFARVGCFARESELWWIGANDNKTLAGLQRALASELQAEGLPVDSKKFKPHITLAREMNIGRIDSVRLLPETIVTEVSAISLMVSERIGGRLTYSEIYRRSAE